MSDRYLITSRPTTTKVVAASGRLRNEHFLLTADHILLEVETATFELVSAMAEGSIEIHMTCPDAESEYVIFAQSAVFQPHRQRLTLNGWIGVRENGVMCGPVASHGHLVVPTDGSFLLPHITENPFQTEPLPMPQAA